MLGDMSESKLGFRPDRLQAMIERRGLRPGQMEYLTGVSQPTISLILNGKRPNPGAQVLARLMGHATIDVLKKYLALVEYDLEDAAAKFGVVDNL